MNELRTSRFLLVKIRSDYGAEGVRKLSSHCFRYYSTKRRKDLGMIGRNYICKKCGTKALLTAKAKPIVVLNLKWLNGFPRNCEEIIMQKVLE